VSRPCLRRPRRRRWCSLHIRGQPPRGRQPTRKPRKGSRVLSLEDLRSSPQPKS
jgi:hypothetical protein